MTYIEYIDSWLVAATTKRRQLLINVSYHSDKITSLTFPSSQSIP